MRIPIHRNLPKFAARKMHHHAAETAVTHQQVRPAPDHKQRQFFRRAMLNEPRETGFRFRLHPELRRSAHAQSRVLAQRLVKPRHARSHRGLQFLRAREFRRELRPLLVDISRAETQNEIAWLASVRADAAHSFSRRGS